MRPPVLLLVAAGLFAVALGALACSENTPGPEETPTTTGSTPTATPTGEPTPTGTATEEPFEGSLEPVEKQAVGGRLVTLTAVRVGEHADFDRFVVEFGEGDTVYGYRVEYIVPPMEQCGSGELVTLDGTAVLAVRIRTAVAHDDEGEPTIDDLDIETGFDHIMQAKIVCDFEGLVEWGLGVAEELPFRVMELQDPPRLVIDVGH